MNHTKGKGFLISTVVGRFEEYFIQRIPKAGTTEKRPLGIPTLNDRAMQAWVQQALEPEWEARFELNSYGFRPGRSAHDAIEAIWVAINKKAKYVLDADIAKCFDRIDYIALLTKLNTFPTLRRQVKSWLKAGLMEGGQLFPTAEGPTGRSDLPIAGQHRSAWHGNGHSSGVCSPNP